MRIVAFAATGLLVSFAAAQSVSPRLASVIPPDTALIYSIDLERYADSALQSFYPMAEEGVGHCPGKLRQIITAERTPNAGGGKLTILRGGSLASACASTDDSIEAAPIPAPKLTVLETGTAITGDQDTVRSALERWQEQAGSVDGDLAAEVRRMSETFDNWLIAVRPLHSVAEDQSSKSHRSYRSEFADVVQEVRAGVRLGKSIEVEAEVEMKTPEDATAAAGLGRWLRGLLQTRWGPEAALAEIAENLSVKATGNMVSLAFTLDSAKVQKLADEWRETEKALTEGSSDEQPAN